MAEYGKAVPREVKGWNWGAFMFNIVWGVGNKTYLPLLCFVPLLNIVWVNSGIDRCVMNAIASVISSV
ncbi:MULTISPECIES: hypothetical protein [Lonsdalea]|uniref:hypothetical protein n=1 Tax=Lonsdalea TaxID=1082702 RepID=UPI0018D4AD41|nr:MULTISPECIES: hypothetical protein [Lonsdalea]QPQ24674.1 hypothetical protein I6N93_02345 [Lonsdalea populi]